MSEVEFYIARIEFDQQLTLFAGYNSENTEQDLFYEEMMAFTDRNTRVYPPEDDDEEEEPENEWFFGDVRGNNIINKSNSSNRCIVGKFGKSYRNDPEIYDREEADFVESEESTKESDYSMFIIDPVEEIIIFNQVYRVRNKNFKDNFERAYEAFRSEDDGSITLKFIDNNKSLTEILSEYTVTESELTVHPYADDAEDRVEIENLMNELGAREFTITPKSDLGLNTDSEFLRDSAELVEETGSDYEIVYKTESDLKAVKKSGKDNAILRDDRPNSVGWYVSHGSELIEYALSIDDEI
ncbi:hypothetical protein [Salinirubrum litoreum]|uniref:Uncharacterized protein n=1 Tax=Salinirubrum litoreum TaxID=1126234 RepID=A0ABD5R701_9EURY|nr:hypothetical protein [Salinirubrum litoreum]